MSFHPNALGAKLQAGQVVYGTCMCVFTSH